MKTLITGGAGYIGSRLARGLAAGHEVTVLDNNHRGTAYTPGTRHIAGDVRDAALLDELTRGIDVIFHLAAESAVMSAEAEPVYCFETNVAGTFNVLQSARAHGVKRVIYTSSREVYGDAAQLPVAESAPFAARNVYGATKAAGEVLCGAFHDLQISIVRLSNVYGPGDKGRVIPLFIRRALAGETLTLFGTEKVMDFVWVNDVVSALNRLGTGSFIPGPLNLGSGTGIKILDLAQRVNEAASSKSEIAIAPARDIEVSRFVADITAARAALGWAPAEDPLFGLPEVVLSARS